MKKNIQELSTVELHKKKKLTVLATATLTGMLLVLLILAIYLILFKGGSFSFIAVVFALTPILFINFKEISKVKRELENRDIHKN